MGDNDKQLAVQQEQMPAVPFNPQGEIEHARQAANALMEIINNKEKKVVMNGETYLEFEDWQTIARFYHCTVTVEWTRPLMTEPNGKPATLVGYEARANVIDREGRILSSAEASVTRAEKKWNMRTVYGYEGGRRVKTGEEQVPAFQLKSMAQTRACAKAIRNVFAWVVVLAGYKPTPAEELEIDEAPAEAKPAPRPVASNTVSPVEPTPAAGVTCFECKRAVDAEVASYSKRVYGLPLCRDHQQLEKYQRMKQNRG